MRGAQLGILPVRSHSKHNLSQKTIAASTTKKKRKFGLNKIRDALTGIFNEQSDARHALALQTGCRRPPDVTIGRRRFKVTDGNAWESRP